MVVTERTIEGVTITLSIANGFLLGAHTYFDGTPLAFGGPNAPGTPENVSLTRFISTLDASFGAAIAFEFSAPVTQFGITTIDLLQVGSIASEFIALVKDSSLASVIALEELSKRATDISSAEMMAFEPLFTAAVLYLGINVILSFGVRLLEKKLGVAHRDELIR